MKSPPIIVWTEPIDTLMSAICARCEVERRYGLYRLTVYALVETGRLRDWQFDWRAAGEQRLRHVLAEQHGGRLPYVMYPDVLPGHTDDEPF